ncbi:601_t:CDS:2 [Acaulospora colombiana]|uniref:601_t:CDS:1 n=1 Tax=Acaulospora colombiana TaxID=27376 RepID=A0ACA9K716_9GLOM|nr:601_t:CDS:2 [Acaulospora colombiana]
MLKQQSIALLLIFLVLIGYTSAIDITIKVDELGLAFNPQNFTANKGDNIKWVMSHGKHIIQQSDSATSCKNSTQANAFYSGIVEKGGEYNYMVTQDSGTIYYCCAYSSHSLLGEFGIISIGVGPSTNTDNGISANSSGSHNEGNSIKGVAKIGIGVNVVVATAVAIGFLLI